MYSALTISGPPVPIPNDSTCISLSIFFVFRTCSSFTYDILHQNSWKSTLTPTPLRTDFQPVIDEHGCMNTLVSLILAGDKPETHFYADSQGSCAGLDSRCLQQNLFYCPPLLLSFTSLLPIGMSITFQLKHALCDLRFLSQVKQTKRSLKIRVAIHTFLMEVY